MPDGKTFTKKDGAQEKISKVIEEIKWSLHSMLGNGGIGGYTSLFSFGLLLIMHEWDDK